MLDETNIKSVFQGSQYAKGRSKVSEQTPYELFFDPRRWVGDKPDALTVEIFYFETFGDNMTHATLNSLPLLIIIKNPLVWMA